jgi:2-dehydropantoate 2-reductase
VKIAVIGAGALGGFVGANLARAGQDVVLVDANPERVEAINSNGLRLQMPGEDVNVEIQARRAEELTGPYDLLVILTKGIHTEGAISDSRHLLGDSTYVLTFQNGLGNVDVIAKFANPDRILVGMTNWAADFREPAGVVSVGSGEIRIWHSGARNDPLIHDIAAVFYGAGLNCIADPLVDSAIWEKVAFNAAMNSISAITLRNVGEIGDDPDARALVEDVAREVLSVAGAKSVPVDRARVMAMFDEAFRCHRSHQPSMLQDRLAGRETEIQFINGAVASQASRLGIQVPVTEALLRLVRFQDRCRLNATQKN